MLNLFLGKSKLKSIIDDTDFLPLIFWIKSLTDYNDKNNKFILAD